LWSPQLLIDSAFARLTVGFISAGNIKIQNISLGNIKFRNFISLGNISDGTGCLWSPLHPSTAPPQSIEEPLEIEDRVRALAPGAVSQD
jgi:hypothetical protein